MDKNADLIQLMAEAFIAAVRALETENAQLRSENELLALELREQEASGDQWYLTPGRVDPERLNEQIKEWNNR